MSMSRFFITIQLSAILWDIIIYYGIYDRSWTYIEGKGRSNDMNTYTGIILIAVILVVVLLIGTMKSRAEWMINFVLRGVLGMMSIYFVNFLLADAFPGIQIGYNPITFLTTGILGFPGIAMLYGINFYMLLWFGKEGWRDEKLTPINLEFSRPPGIL